MSRSAYAPQVRASVAALVSLGAFVGYSSPLVAAEDDEDEVLQEVQVTGTRIQSPNVTAANPVTSVTAEEMRSLGIVNVAEAACIAWWPGHPTSRRTTSAIDVNNAIIAPTASAVMLVDPAVRASS